MEQVITKRVRKKKQVVASVAVKVYGYVNNHPRRVLGEGRNKGLGFAFCKLITNGEKNTLEAVQPISPCKDYLNDVVYSERTGKPFSAYGLNTSKNDIFNDKIGYLVMSVCKRGATIESDYDGYKSECELLNNNIPNLQLFINFFEEKFKVSGRTNLVKLADNLVLAELPLFWTEATYLISLFTLIARIGMFYKNGDVLDYFYTSKENSADSNTANIVKNKINLMMAGNIPKQDIMNLTGVHNCGIMSFKF